MTHLSGTELVDYLEGGLTGARARHLDGCDFCRSEADALRSALVTSTSVARDDVPEPSPLFWEHFSHRVREAVHDAEPPRMRWRWLRPPLVKWVGAIAVAVLAVSAILWRGTVQPRQPDPRAPVVAEQREPTPEATRGAEVSDGDADWALVRIVAEDLQWEEAPDAGIGTGPGAAEGVALDMSPAERRELVRLIADELKQTGA